MGDCLITYDYLIIYEEIHFVLTIFPIDQYPPHTYIAEATRVHFKQFFGWI